ncbi:MAG: LLM class F420-dependent oxidoreductase [Solirubrobacterales bacterium]
MRIGVSLPNVGLDHGKEMLLPIAEAAERLGFDSLWAAHHVVLPYERASEYPYQRSGTEIAMNPGMQWLDPLITLATVAGATEKVGLGTSVLVLPYRNPVTLAAEVAALDVLSEGRLILGVGSGWMREEFEAIGIDPAERGARTDEHIQVLKTLWRDDPASFDGRFTRFKDVALATTPRSEGGPPIWVGGNKEPGMRRALQYGDGWHSMEVYPEDMQEVNSELARIGQQVGRDPAQLDISVVRGLIPPGQEDDSFIPERRMLGGSAQSVIDELGAYQEAGVDLVLIQISLLAPLVPDALEWVASEVLSAAGPPPVAINSRPR